MASQPYGQKRGISALEEDKKNESLNLIYHRSTKTPKLHSLQLDHLYKKFLKENNVPRGTSKVRPNLKSSRTVELQAPLASPSSTSTPSLTAQAQSLEWETPKKTIKLAMPITLRKKMQSRATLTASPTFRATRWIWKTWVLRPSLHRVEAKRQTNHLQYLQVIPTSKV